MSALDTFSIVVVALAFGIAGGFGLSRWLRIRKTAQTDRFESSLGFNYLVSNETDRALEVFSHVAETNPEAVDIHVVLGNLYREKGQTEQAIRVHRELLARTDLSRRDRALVLFCLALDFKKGGFVDRSAANFQEVLDLEPNHREALAHLEKLYEGMRDWSRAYNTANQLQELDGSTDERILAFLRNQMGDDALSDGDVLAAQQHFMGALAHDRRCVPAALNLGNLYLSQRKFKRARAIFEEVLDRDPRRLGLVWRRLLGVYRSLGESGRLEDLCCRRLDADPNDWRARVVLGELAEEMQEFELAASYYSEAIRRNPYAFSLHHRLLGILVKTEAEPKRLHEYLELCEDSFVLTDRYVCVRCHYRAGELLWRCPSCQQWDPFVEEQA